LRIAALRFAQQRRGYDKKSDDWQAHHYLPSRCPPPFAKLMVRWSSGVVNGDTMLRRAF